MNPSGVSPAKPAGVLRASLLALVVLALGLCIPAHAQGCSQCREAVGQTPARTQSAYRRAIVLMVTAGAGIFSAGLVVLKRYR